MEKADAHRSIDPWPVKTGGGEQRAHVTPSSDAKFRPCMPVGERAGRRVTWNHFLFSSPSGLRSPTVTGTSNRSLWSRLVMGLISYTESPVYKSTNDDHSSPAGHSEKYAGRSSRGRAAELEGLT